MFRRLIIITLIATLFASCKQSKTAFNYSEDFAKREQSLAAEIASTESSVKTFASYQMYDSIRAAGERMEKLFDKHIGEIKDKPAPDVKEGENFKAAGIKYFEFMKSVYTGYKEYGSATTDEERSAILARIQQIASRKEAVSLEIQEAQQKFAKANGFTVK